MTGPLPANYACKASAHAYGHAGSMGSWELAKAAGRYFFASRCLNLWRSSTKFSLKTYIFAASKIPGIDHCD